MQDFHRCHFLTHESRSLSAVSTGTAQDPTYLYRTILGPFSHDRPGPMPPRIREANAPSVPGAMVVCEWFAIRVAGTLHGGVSSRDSRRCGCGRGHWEQMTINASH